MRLPRGLPKLRPLNQIRQPELLSYMKNGNCPAFVAKYSLYYHFPITAPLKLTQYYHPCHLPFIEHYTTRSDPLWSFLVLSKTVSGKKAIIRRWLLRRIRAAFTKALEEAGYARDGSKIPGTLGLKPELRGTLAFIVQPGIFEMNHQNLLANTRKVLQTVMEWCSKARPLENKTGYKRPTQKEFAERYTRQGELKTSYKAPEQSPIAKRWTKQEENKTSYRAPEQKEFTKRWSKQTDISEVTDRRDQIRWTKQSLNGTGQQDVRNSSSSAGRQNTYYQAQNDKPRWRKTPS